MMTTAGYNCRLPTSHGTPPMPATTDMQLPVLIIGGGPTGLIAAETLLRQGIRVMLCDTKPSVARKFLLAGKSGLNLTHAEPLPEFLGRYGEASARLEPMIQAFSPEKLRRWCADLGIATFTGSSGRVFPEGMKATPLLRAWLRRLRELGLEIRTRHRWTGWDASGDWRFDTPDGVTSLKARAVILALGGGSWARLGSDGAWQTLLAGRGVDVRPLVPANCGFDVRWSAAFADRYAGQPVKTVLASVTDARGALWSKRGDLMITRDGIEGGLVYALAAPLRDRLLEGDDAVLCLDLLPDRDINRIATELARPREGLSLSNWLRKRLGFNPLRVALLRECLDNRIPTEPEALAAVLKALPLRLHATRPLDEAISSAGGVRWSALDDRLMLTALPGVFCAGEMVDWEAPTGGYLLTACFASGYHAAQGVQQYLNLASG